MTKRLEGKVATKRPVIPIRPACSSVGKVGARRGADKLWIPVLSREELIDGVHDNLRNLGVAPQRLP
jgi:pyridoxine 4-dehydrogenase